MPDTFVKIASVTVGSGGAATMDFTSIPADYTDLVLKVSARTNNTGSGNGFLAYFNSSTTSYTRRIVYGDGSTPSSGSYSNAVGGLVNGTTETSNTFSSTDLYIPNYAGANNKSVSSDTVMENNATFAYVTLAAGLWSNTAAITSISLTPNVGNFVQYSTATLYGIKNS